MLCYVMFCSVLFCFVLFCLFPYSLIFLGLYDLFLLSTCCLLNEFSIAGTFIYCSNLPLNFISRTTILIIFLSSFDYFLIFSDTIVVIYNV
jgi:hypothetical protein